MPSADFCTVMFKNCTLDISDSNPAMITKVAVKGIFIYILVDYSDAEHLRILMTITTIAVISDVYFR